MSSPHSSIKPCRPHCEFEASVPFGPSSTRTPLRTPRAHTCRASSCGVRADSSGVALLLARGAYTRSPSTQGGRMPARRGVALLIVMLGLIGAFALFITLAFRHSLPTLSGPNVLVLDVPSYLNEGARPLGPYPFSFWPNRMTVWDVESGIRRAAND